MEHFAFSGNTSYLFQLKQRFDTRAVLDIGTVTSSGAGTEEANQIIVVVEVVYFSIGSYADGDEHKLSAGMAYASDMYIWISQLGVNVKSTSGVNIKLNIYFDIKVQGLKVCRTLHLDEPAMVARQWKVSSQCPPRRD